MVFSSYLFIFFFLPLALLGYYAASKKHSLRKVISKSACTNEESTSRAEQRYSPLSPDAQAVCRIYDPQTCIRSYFSTLFRSSCRRESRHLARFLWKFFCCFAAGLAFSFSPHIHAQDHADLIHTNQPFAVPVVTAEEAKTLIDKIETEHEESLKRGWVFHEENFVFSVNASPKILQTFNWRFVPKNEEEEANSSAKYLDYFTITSETPLEYHFVEPLLEQTLYSYTLCCSAKGKGTIVISQKGGKDSKEFPIDSKTFETAVYRLGDGSTLNTKIEPEISFRGNLKIESITLHQKELNNQWTVCLGSIEEISNVPDIRQANYPDCYYTAKFVVKDILDGRPVPQNIQLLIPAFLNNKIDPLSKKMKQGEWKVSIRPFSLATKEEQEIEQVDEIESYLLTPYILVAATAYVIPELTVSGIPILEGETYVSPFDSPVNPPLPDKYAEDSNKEIKNELAKVDRLIEQAKDIDSINEAFQSAWDEKQKSYDSLNSTTIWAKERNSFFALPKNWTFIPSDRIAEENVDAIAELDHFFKSQGIQLIIQIVPDFRDIAALVLNPDFQKYGDQRSARVARQLLERGIETQYISDEIVRKAFDYERLFFYPSDYHPDEGAMDIMTSIIARRLEKFGNIISKNLDATHFSRENRDTGYKTKLKWPNNVDIGSHEPDSTVQVPYILYDEEILESDPDSNILVFGNSFTQEPMTKNAYISYLAPKLLHNCSCRSMGGISPLTALPQLFLTSPETYLKDKQVAILPIGVTFLTDDIYFFPNVTKVDEVLKSSSKSKFLTELPLRQDDRPLFPSSFRFANAFLDFLPYRTSSIALSAANPKYTIEKPKDITANKVRISIQPLFGYGVSILVNGESYRIPSRFNPKWEILEFDIDENDPSISIELDIDKCTSSDAKVIIGNVSLFE